LRQRLRPDLDNNALGPLDFLDPVQDGRILAKRGLDGLIEGKCA
jgi:hypothetical protein